MWEPKMWELKICRLAWQLLGMLGNVLGRPQHALQRPRHAYKVLGVLDMLCNVLGVLDMLCNVLGVPHRRKIPPLAAL